MSEQNCFALFQNQEDNSFYNGLNPMPNSVTKEAISQQKEEFNGSQLAKNCDNQERPESSLSG